MKAKIIVFVNGRDHGLVIIEERRNRRTFEYNIISDNLILRKIDIIHGRLHRHSRPGRSKPLLDVLQPAVMYAVSTGNARVVIRLKR